MSWWKTYSGYVRRICLKGEESHGKLSRWRNMIFVWTLVYMLPLCLIALVPGVAYSFALKLNHIAYFDMVIAIMVTVLSLIPGLKISVRKMLFIAVCYTLAVFLIYYLGYFGAGLIYLFATAIFAQLIFEARYVWIMPSMNFLICAAFCVPIYYQAMPWGESQTQSIGAWIAVTSNIVFLSFVFAGLSHALFNGIRSTIDSLSLLKRDLLYQKRSLEQKNRELNQFASVASHDLKEPLRMVASFTTMLHNGYADKLDDKAKQYIHFAHDGATRMSRTVNDLLEYSRMGLEGLKMEKTDLNIIIDEIKTLFSLPIAESSATIHAENLPTVMTYKGPVRQIFQNLISNALKYMPDGKQPEVQISAKKIVGVWQFCVSDNGIGIDKNQQDRIFVIFKRLHSVNEYPGSGIGLAACKKMVEKMGGKIWVESSEGMGSRFYFTLLEKPLS